MATRSRAPAAFYKGDAGRKKAEEELVKQKARAEARKEQQNMPFRFRVAVGGSTQIVILDDAPDFYRFEHNLKNPQTGFWDTYTGCIKEDDNCPVCEVSGRESYYALYLSVLDLTEFSTKDGQKHEFSRKLLVVKPAQQKKFIRAYNKAEKDGVTLRGAIFEVTRDGDKDSAIGNDIEFVEYMDEEELTSYVRTWKDREGKKQTEDCSVPYDYEELFEPADADALRALVGAEPTPGSRAHERKALGGGATRGRRAAAEDDDDVPPTRGRTGRTAGRSSEYEAPARTERMRGRAAAPVEEEEEEEEPPVRQPARSRGRVAEPEPRGRSRRAAPVEEEEEEPAPRGRTAGRRPAHQEEEPPPRRGATRRAPVEEEEEEPPPGRRLPIRGRR